MSGKGSTPRRGTYTRTFGPSPQDKYEDNWGTIFGKPTRVTVNGQEMTGVKEIMYRERHEEAMRRERRESRFDR